ncbi:transcriptional regulator GcvA [Brevundimonas sp. 2R-24]|uniref:Transcriptional regulator GcvA n=1 Tax=Peiella sedimenti TaxID=3061083 RepID=A0ABT8SNQ9_9CAUL|nr:transcriptional regulator GcvA [Caulobacteraceae bacterium XZ-24]
MAHIPPLSTLRALEAAVRLRSYSRAAAELHVTHGAVSHQIRALEEQFGVKLFHRAGRGMAPTPAAERLAGEVAEAVGLLRQAVNRLEAESSPSTLVISTLSSFFRRMLAPRLDRFTSRYPSVTLDIRSEERLADFTTDGVDLALRYGEGSWPRVRADPLFQETLLPVCSPAFRDRHGIETLEDLRRVPLLRHRMRTWTLWCRIVGLEMQEPQGGLVFDDSSDMLDAAVEGLGVALARSALAQPDLRSGRLVRLFDIDHAVDWGYFVVWREDSLKRVLIERFRDWLVEEFRQAEVVAP